MRVTTGDIRQIVLDPVKYVNAQTSRNDRGPFFPPQRSWIESSLKAYFQADRNDAVLWKTFHAKVHSKPLNAYRAGLARSAEDMLNRFLDWDYEEQRLPADWMWNKHGNDVQLDRHTIAPRIDLVYVSPRGFRIRQIWTDSQLHLTHANASLLAAAVYWAAEHELGGNRIDDVEVWQLRHAEKHIWNASQLKSDLARLIELLDFVADASV